MKFWKEYLTLDWSIFMPLKEKLNIWKWKCGFLGITLVTNVANEEILLDTADLTDNRTSITCVNRVKRPMFCEKLHEKYSSDTYLEAIKIIRDTRGCVCVTIVSPNDN